MNQRSVRETDDAPQLRRQDLGEGDWAIETRLEAVAAEEAGYWAALEVGFDAYDQLWFGMVDDGYLKTIRVGDSWAAFESTESLPLSLRIEKQGEEYTLKYKHDPSEAWTVRAPLSYPGTPTYAGLIGRGFWTGSSEMHMDWSYFRLERWEAEEMLRAAPGGEEGARQFGEESLPGTEQPPVTGTPMVRPTSTVTPTASQAPTATMTPAPRPTGMELPKMTARLAPVALQLPALPMWALEEETLSQTITYSYDGLYRLTAADYSSGQYFHYSYDTVGNRLSEETQAGTKEYVYDIANRLTEVDGMTYTWDDNGNLLSDGVSTYSYDGANRLSSVAQGSNTYGFSYNGLGDRLSQTVDGVTTSYTLDLNAGLTQVLSDGTSTYLYGNGRIAQEGTSTEYFLGDALGSVRQMADEAGAITLQKSYDPFGNMMASAGSGASAFAYTGEQTDASGLVNLRARYYSPMAGRFTTKDAWEGNANHPTSYNYWLYAAANPLSYVDPTGYYNRAAAVSYATSHDLMDPFPAVWRTSGAYNTECTVFASFVLWEGGIRDPRPVPASYIGPYNLTWYHDYDNTDRSNFWPKPDVSYWNGDWADSATPYGDHLGISFSSWQRTPDFYRFLTEQLRLPSYRISTEYGALHSALRTIPFEVGDLVFYGSTHVAVIVNKWMPETSFQGFPSLGGGEITTWTDYQNYYDRYGLPIDEKMNQLGSEALEIWKQTRCDTYQAWLPRVVERSGAILYHGSRSITDTYVQYPEITIVHVQ